MPPTKQRKKNKLIFIMHAPALMSALQPHQKVTLQTCVRVGAWDSTGLFVFIRVTDYFRTVQEKQREELNANNYEGFVSENWLSKQTAGAAERKRNK